MGWGFSIGGSAPENKKIWEFAQRLERQQGGADK
jgi:hypothetical protein